jgi:hypothetical protein
VEIHPPNGHRHPYGHSHQPGHSQLHGQSLALRQTKKSGLAAITLQVLIALLAINLWHFQCLETRKMKKSKEIIKNPLSSIDQLKLLAAKFFVDLFTFLP